MNFPYVQSADKLKRFLQMIPDIGVPEKFTLKTLKSMGFTSSNDERFVGVLKAIGFLGSDSSPTDLWKKARGNLTKALAEGVRNGYSDLFQQFPDAHRKDEEALRTFFSVNSGLGAAAVGQMAVTFKAVCDLAEFDSDSVLEALESITSIDDSASTKEKTKTRTKVLSDQAPTISVNIQLQLPPDATGEIYDKFFEAMKTHIWPK